MECWWAQHSSHDGSVHVHSHARSVRGTQLMAAGWAFVEMTWLNPPPGEKSCIKPWVRV